MFWLWPVTWGQVCRSPSTSGVRLALKQFQMLKHLEFQLRMLHLQQLPQTTRKVLASVRKLLFNYCLAVSRFFLMRKYIYPTILVLGQHPSVKALEKHSIGFVTWDSSVYSVGLLKSCFLFFSDYNAFLRKISKIKDVFHCRNPSKQASLQKIKAGQLWSIICMGSER